MITVKDSLGREIFIARGHAGTLTVQVVCPDGVEEPSVELGESAEGVTLRLNGEMVLSNFPLTEFSAPTCDAENCSNPIKHTSQAASSFNVTSRRLNRYVCYAFCSAECQASWYEEAGGTVLDEASISATDTDIRFTHSDKSGVEPYAVKTVHDFSDAATLNEWWATPTDQEADLESLPDLVFSRSQKE